MTVEEIKEYIRKRIVKLGIPKDKDIYDFYRLKEITVTKSNDEKIDELENVYLMLDELEQPIEIDTKKYFETMDKLIDKEMAQHLKDQMKKALKKEIEKGE